jgi:hypothetical protein
MLGVLFSILNSQFYEGFCYETVVAELKRRYNSLNQLRRIVDPLQRFSLGIRISGDMFFNDVTSKLYIL